MADLLAEERATEQHVLTLLKNSNVSVPDVQVAFSHYRLLVQAVIAADFQNAESREVRLWNIHGEGKRWFSKNLKDFRKKHSDRPVEERVLKKAYLDFIKKSNIYYRGYIYEVNQACGGMPQLEDVAHMATGGRSGGSQLQPIPPISKEVATASCHRSLIYLGDLARYRAADKLDDVSDMARAVGYYNLAVTIVPSSGLGHHQQAVVALDPSSRNHLLAIYHLYRSIAIPDPHPNGVAHLAIEFDKTNAAWDRGELIQKGLPNDPDASKHALVGWFVRFHSMCFRGEEFRGHEELEREVLSQLSNVIKQRPLDTVLHRIIATNMAAQYVAGEKFQANPTNSLQQSFLFYFRFNLRTFTTLLQVFYDDLRHLLLNMDDQDVELASKLTPIGRRVLPALRVYTNWLLLMARMTVGVSSYTIVGNVVTAFWPSYARVIDLIAQAFPIWDLEDLDEVSYMLDEDVETQDFKAVTCDFTDANNTITRKTWYNKYTGKMKAKCKDRNVVRVSTDDEMLQRVRDLLADGLYLANDDDSAPIHLRGTRIFYGDETNIEPLIVRPVEYQPAPIAPPKAQEKPKPVSYAAAAANGHARRPPPAQRKASTSKPQSRDAQLSRMVDDLVDDDDGNNPVTPPQQHASNPAVVTNGEVPQALQDSAIQEFQQPKAYAMKNVAIRPNVTVTPPPAHPAGNVARTFSGQHDRMQSVSKLWGNDQGPVSSFPNGLPAGTPLASPMVSVGGHSRGNSASSIRSRGSMNASADPWAPDSAPRALPDSAIPQTAYGNYSSLDQSGMGSPLLFGAGGGPWSTGAPRGYRNASSPNGQGG